MKIIPAYIIEYSNSDFTNPHELLFPDDPKDCTIDHTHMGVKYTGLETKRHLATKVSEDYSGFEYNHNLYNWVKIGFKERGEISEIRISTKWFTGNQVRAVSIVLIDELTGEETEVLKKKSLLPDHNHIFKIPSTLATECYCKLYHEGGISRIHFLGEMTKEQIPEKTSLLDKASISHVSNEHYGNPTMAINGNRTDNFMSGWESARTGFGEHALFHLRKPSVISEIVVDTYLHRLNAPLSCHIFGLQIKQGKVIDKEMLQAPKWKLIFEDGHEVIPNDFQAYMLEEKFLEEEGLDPSNFTIKMHLPFSCPWKPILPFEILRPDCYHRFNQLKSQGTYTHILYLHYPNGGIHGLKIFGEEKGEGNNK